MNSTTHTFSAPSRATSTRPILLGGLLAGLADFIWPTVNTVMAGGSWVRPWKGVAGGLLGRPALEGGAGTVALGIGAHFFICIVAAALLYAIAKHVRWIPRQWIALGILYGIAFLAVMNYVILPLSAIGRPLYPVNGLHVAALTHILLVGLPTAFFVSRALQRSEQ